MTTCERRPHEGSAAEAAGPEQIVAPRTDNGGEALRITEGYLFADLHGWAMRVAVEADRELQQLDEAERGRLRHHIDQVHALPAYPSKFMCIGAAVDLRNAEVHRLAAVMRDTLEWICRGELGDTTTPFADALVAHMRSAAFALLQQIEDEVMVASVAPA